MFIWFIFAGAIAQLVDGTLGMAFGVTSTTLMVAIGATPLVASAAVHFAELGTTLASGLSHWRENNVDKGVVLRLGIPGAIGGFGGATLLSHISTEGSKTYVAGLLFVLGIIIVLRFGAGIRIIPPLKGKLGLKSLAPLGLIGGFVDASGGGGWGPITTPTLLTITKTEPRKVIGTVSASEFLVTAAASLGFVLAPVAGDTASQIDFKVVFALMLGGVLMAPIAARLAGRLPHAPFGVIVGSVVLMTNARTIMKAYDVAGPQRFTVLLAFTATGIALAIRAWRQEKLVHPPHTPAEVAHADQD
jgi:uncharacterized membrane protein YfcA